MNRNRRSAPTSIACVVLVLCLAASLFAATPSSKSADKSKDANASDNYDEQFARYLEAARRLPPTAGPDIGWVIGLAGDHRARHVNDLLTVQVIENITGTGSADSALTKDGKGAAAVTNAFGVEHKLPAWIDPTNLVSGASKTDFKGTGATSRTGSLTATMTVRVAEVLPNGDLVLEGAREIEINGDRQIVVLSGVARASDVTPANVVLSTQVGQLRIRYFGKGLMKDNLKPGWLIRIMNKIF
jgi:flagellar L-ring protein precursor FlgH